MRRFCTALSIAWGSALPLAACTAPYAPQQADLFREPPPVLPAEANAFWNDPKRGTYGELTVGAHLYRRGDETCRTARATAIHDATRTTEDRTLLYCAGASSDFHLDPTLSCRAPQIGQGITVGSIACRNPAGDDFVLPPV
jgi:hypothetical protein